VLKQRNFLRIVTFVFWTSTWSMAFPMTTANADTGSKPANCKAGDTFLLESIEAGRTKYMLYVCDSQLNSPRLLSRGELFKMYNATKSEAESMAIWRKVSDSGAEDSKVLSQLSAIPDSDLIGVDEDQVTMTKLADWYRQHVAQSSAAPPALIRGDKIKKFMASTDSTLIAACLSNQGSFVMSESKKAGASGCKCGSAAFNNYVDYTCSGNKLVPASGTRPGGTSGTSR
jgi:hypothetical protein